MLEKLYSLSIPEASSRFRKLDKYVNNGDQQLKSNQLNQLSTSSNDDKIHDIIPIVTLCTLDIICETAMGTKLNLQRKETDYVRCIQEVEKFFLWRLTRPWLWFDSIYRWTNDYKENERCLEVMRKFTVSVIEKRKKIWLNYFEQYATNHPETSDEQNKTKKPIYETNNNNNNALNASSDEDKEINEDEKFRNFFTGTKTRLAFLDLLLQQHFKDPKNFTTEDVKEEADTFMFAVRFIFNIDSIY